VTQQLEVICVATDTVPGYNICEVLGAVSGVCIQELKGKLPEQQDGSVSARRTAYSSLQESAYQMGADAVVGIIAESAVLRDRDRWFRECNLQGTAVVLEDYDGVRVERRRRSQEEATDQKEEVTDQKQGDFGMSQHEEIICTTTDTVPGRNIREVLGVTWGTCFSAADDYPSQDAFNASTNARSTAYRNLVERARLMGANAVVGIIVSDSFLSRTRTGRPVREYVLYGTAVVVE